MNELLIHCWYYVIGKTVDICDADKHPKKILWQKSKRTYSELLKPTIFDLPYWEKVTSAWSRSPLPKDKMTNATQQAENKFELY